jgi:hypothetical protein
MVLVRLNYAIKSEIIFVCATEYTQKRKYRHIEDSYFGN